MRVHVKASLRCRMAMRAPTALPTHSRRRQGRRAARARALECSRKCLGRYARESPRLNSRSRRSRPAARLASSDRPCGLAPATAASHGSNTNALPSQQPPFNGAVVPRERVCQRVSHSLPGHSLRWARRVVASCSLRKSRQSGWLPRPSSEHRNVRFAARCCRRALAAATMAARSTLRRLSAAAERAYSLASSSSHQSAVSRPDGGAALTSNHEVAPIFARMIREDRSSYLSNTLLDPRAGEHLMPASSEMPPHAPSCRRDAAAQAA